MAVLNVAPIPENNDVTTPARRLTLEWFTWLNSLRNAVVLLSTMVHVVRGDPNGAEVGSIGHVALRLDGGAVSTFYVKESGTDTTAGWVAK